MKIKKILVGVLVVSGLVAPSTWACINDMTKEQSKFVDKYTTCQEALRRRNVKVATSCLSGLADQLEIFAEHPREAMFQSEFWYVSALTNLANHAPELGRANMEKSRNIEPRSKVEMELSLWEQTVERTPDDLMEEAYAIATHRINVMRNPRIKDRTLSDVVPGSPSSEQTQNAANADRRRIRVPDTDARDVIFGEAGLTTAIEKVGLDELDKDMLFMKAAGYKPAKFVETFEARFEASKLKVLSERAKHYYQVE